MEEDDPHLCHARGCTKKVPPKLLMCRKHWRMVPPELQTAVWAHYRPGQEVDKQPTEQYLEIARQAILAVWEQERAHHAPHMAEAGRRVMRGRED